MEALPPEDGSKQPEDEENENYGSDGWGAAFHGVNSRAWLCFLSVATH